MDDHNAMMTTFKTKIVIVMPMTMMGRELSRAGSGGCTMLEPAAVGRRPSPRDESPSVPVPPRTMSSDEFGIGGLLKMELKNESSEEM